MSNLFLVMLGIFTSALAQIMLKKSGQFAFLKEGGFFLYFILGGLSYVFSFGLYTYLLKVFNLSKISPVMTIATMIIVVSAGIIFFKETVGWRQALGIAMGIVSITLIVK